VKRFEPKLNVLPPEQRLVWDELTRSIPNDFVLYGGTSIALRLGHRTSVDFHFFSSEPFSPGDLQQQVKWVSAAEPIQSSANTLTVILKRGGPVKVSFFGGLTFGRVSEPELAGQSDLACASLLDLAATKLKVLHERAEAKDYLDLAALLAAGGNLSQMLGAARSLYGEVFNPIIALKALVYFEDGDLPGLPRNIKKLLEDAVGAFVGVAETPLVSTKVGRAPSRKA